MDAKRALGGLTLIAIGGILLANTTGVLPWSVWVSIISLWPIALIAAGIDIIGTSTRRTWVRVIAGLLTLAALLYGAFVMPPGTWGFAAVSSVGRQGLTSYSFTEPRSAAVTTGRARINAGATRLSLAAGDSLATLTGEGPATLRPSLAAAVSGGTADVSVSFGERVAILPGFGAKDRMNVTLDRDVRWSDVAVNAGAVQMDLDLTGLKIDSLSANIGASASTVTFPADQTCRAQVNGGACSIICRVPRGAKVTLEVRGFPVATSVPAGFARSGGAFGNGTWSRDGTAGDITIAVAAGAASVDVVDY